VIAAASAAVLSSSGRELLGGQRAAVNTYHGMQTREEVFEFTEKPAVKKEGNQYVITFASTAACDATVAIVGPDGKIVRHLASGVLGKNAPRPFQQDSLEQRIEWDGKDNAGKPAPPDCDVHVGLGLKAEFERNIGYDPFAIPCDTGGSQLREVREAAEAGNAFVVAEGSSGETYVLGAPDRAGYQGRVFKKGKYVRTFWPVSADRMENLEGIGYRFSTTTWGDKVFETEGFGPGRTIVRDPRKMKLEEIVKVMFQTAGVSGPRLGARPQGLPAPNLAEGFNNFHNSKQLRMAVDRARDELYVYPARGLMRIDGKTGKVDDAWFPDGGIDKCSEVCVGPDGHVYVSTGAHGYGQFVFRLSREGKPVNFAGDAVPLPKGGKWVGGRGQYAEMEGKPIYGSRVCPAAFDKVEVTSLWTGHFGHSNTHERGMYVSPKGFIVHAVQSPGEDRLLRYGIPQEAPRHEIYGATTVSTSYVSVWDNDGKLLTANAVGDMQNGHGVTMDADDNIYAAMGGRVPAGQENYWGLVDRPLRGHFDHGSLLKFLGSKPFPRGRAYYGEDAPETAAKLKGYRGKVQAIEGAAWIFGGLMCQKPDICTCHNLRYDMDYFARHWLPANHLYSVVVIDANANVIARLGRYGNVDDTQADLKSGRDGLRLVWPRAVAVSDKALYIADTGNRRILKAALSYHTEKTLPVP